MGPPNLLESQLDTLEYPNQKYIENDIIFQSVEKSIDSITQCLLDKIVKNKKNIEIWRQTQRISCILNEYKIWYLEIANRSNKSMSTTSTTPTPKKQNNVGDKIM